MAININGIYTGELHPTAIIAGCINVYENAFPNPVGAISLIEKEVQKQDIYWERASTVGAGVHQNKRTNYMLGISYFSDIADNAACQSVHNQFKLLIDAACISYCKKYGIEENLAHESYSMLKYSHGESYNAHYDGNVKSGRTISTITYLNDDYEGGELEFPYHNIKIKPQAGMLIVFPSNFSYAHVAHPVTQGTKYALVTWLDEI
jgi:Rps23 Pro-64 3,4-dihydroxylase Tpa1-like proline 4-hydroxylase|tara:strand:- start:1768 stop:2385 length:618 start_codon:yes stop_codon:yes gene_type:complete